MGKNVGTMRGMIAECPSCQASCTKIFWDVKKDSCTCTVCGWSSGTNYKYLYEQLLEDFRIALHYAGKNNNVCNLCTKDCAETGVPCPGRTEWIFCSPEWRGITTTKGDE